MFGFIACCRQLTPLFVTVAARRPMGQPATIDGDFTYKVFFGNRVIKECMQGKFAGMCFVDLLLCGMLIGSVGLIRKHMENLVMAAAGSSKASSGV